MYQLRIKSIEDILCLELFVATNSNLKGVRSHQGQQELHSSAPQNILSGEKRIRPKLSKTFSNHYITPDHTAGNCGQAQRDVPGGLLLVEVTTYTT